MSKYYAVKVGRETGIFNSWADCKKQVEGFSGSSYKSFSTLEEAKDYLNLALNNDNNQLEKSSFKTVEVYVDGSYNDNANLYSYGCVILDDKKTNMSGVGTDKQISPLRNVAGELLGTMEAVKWAYNNNYERIKIYHDYEGISKWATGEWNANKEGTKQYVQFLKDFKGKIKIHFIKVKAHSGNKFNDEADTLAKKALNDYINAGKELQEIDKMHTTVEHDLFEKIIKIDDERKNIASFMIKGYKVTEAKLIKVAREIWKNKGYKMKDIDAIKIDIDIDQFKINWLIIDKEQKEHLFSIYIC
ncbi:ribonuclease H family protein [Priestia megaterium]|uniref:ribonuclease H family protein n=1 Tax=Priestia megaterium TaxID=1404 RepID=UPI0031FDD99A